MSNYTKSTNFATKDALPSGDPLKIVKGAEIDTEFNNIATAVATKADLASPTFTGTPALPTGTTAVTQSASDDSTKLATTAFVQDVADAIKSALFPVGAIYTAVVSTNPGTLLGFGTWTAFGAGRVPVGFNAADPLFDAAEETGGSKDATLVSHTHTASTNTTGAHVHRVVADVSSSAQISGDAYISYRQVNVSGDSYDYILGGTATAPTLAPTSSNGDHSHSITVDAAGASATNANLQPYITVYMWKRTA